MPLSASNEEEHPLGNNAAFAHAPSASPRVPMRASELREPAPYGDAPRGPVPTMWRDLGKLAISEAHTLCPGTMHLPLATPSRAPPIMRIAIIAQRKHALSLSLSHTHTTTTIIAIITIAIIAVITSNNTTSSCSQLTHNSIAWPMTPRVVTCTRLQPGPWRDFQRSGKSRKHCGTPQPRNLPQSTPVVNEKTNTPSKRGGIRAA